MKFICNYFVNTALYFRDCNQLHKLLKRLFMRIYLKSVLCLFFSLCLALSAWAQGTQAIITGVVLDNEGLAVIGATIQVKNESSVMESRKRQVIR